MFERKVMGRIKAKRFDDENTQITMEGNMAYLVEIIAKLIQLLSVQSGHDHVTICADICDAIDIYKEEERNEQRNANL